MASPPSRPAPTTFTRRNGGALDLETEDVERPSAAACGGARGPGRYSATGSRMTRILAAKRMDAIRVRRVLGSRLAGSVGRALACLAFGFCLAGCGSPASPGERV